MRKLKNANIKAVLNKKRGMNVEDNKRCNLCGTSFGMIDDIGGIKICTRLGYGSVYDGREVRMNICCKCVESLIDSCEVSPLVPLAYPDTPAILQ